MTTDVIVLKPARERLSPRLPRPPAGPGSRGVSARSTITRPVTAVVDAEPADDSTSSILLEGVLTAGSIFGAIVLFLTLFAAQSGFRPLVVRSGSMEPAISTGSMVLVRRIPASDIKPGDIVSVERADRTRVTHRVITVERQGSNAVLTLKGDANEDPDPAPVTVSSAYRLVLTIGWVGRFTSWLATPAGGFALGCLVTAVGVATLRRRPRAPTITSPASAVRRVAI